MQIGCEILNMCDGVIVALFSSQKSPHGRQSLGVFLGTMCGGEDELLDDGLTMPTSITCSNSWQVILSCSGAADEVVHTLEGLVSMWCYIMFNLYVIIART